VPAKIGTVPPISIVSYSENFCHFFSIWKSLRNRPGKVNRPDSFSLPLRFHPAETSAGRKANYPDAMEE
jgi:hypothetical protein